MADAHSVGLARSSEGAEPPPVIEHDREALARAELHQSGRPDRASQRFAASVLLSIRVQCAPGVAHLVATVYATSHGPFLHPSIGSPPLRSERLSSPPSPEFQEFREIFRDLVDADTLAFMKNRLEHAGEDALGHPIIRGQHLLHFPDLRGRHPQAYRRLAIPLRCSCNVSNIRVADIEEAISAGRKRLLLIVAAPASMPR